MEKAVSLLSSFEAFFKLCKAYTNREIDMATISLNEAVLFNKLAESRESIHKALCDDFNTGLTIEILFDLVSQMNKMFQSSDNSQTVSSDQKDLNRNYGCVMAVSNFVKASLELYGLSLIGL